ncbi:site-2 protease family protein [Candidatus Dependentiae bacterium]|nr:site-2 protease family protein [Candidatus Dependentiae bacterium]
MHGTMSQFLAWAFLVLPVFLLVLSVHEAAHAGVAYLLGDSTAKRMGRLSLNPLVHIDPVGLLALLVFRIGWAKPVIFDHRNFKRPRLYSVLTAYAGPVSNFLLALLAMICWKYFPFTHVSVGVATTFVQLFEATAYVSVMLGVFNLMPIPPLDGSHVLMVLLIDRFPRAVLWLYRYSILILIFFFILIPQTRFFLLFLIGTVYKLLHSLVF